MTGEWVVGSKRAACAVDGCDHTPLNWVTVTNSEGLGELELALVCFLHEGIVRQDYREFFQ